ncbi:MAG: DMT family transporter [Fusobacterium sp.]|nr:DMT family transporter [Fusobacterium sp.]
MFYTLIGVLVRIFSNSYLNVCQKMLTGRGQRASVVNFYTYLGLTFLVLPLLPACMTYFSGELLANFVVMGILGALGNYFIIKALSIGELSTLAPINSYKPVVALLAGIFYLHEIPSSGAILALVLIIAGTTMLIDKAAGGFCAKAVFYRVLALIFSATEAVFIKKIIILTDVSSAFVLWVLAGLVFTALFVVRSVKNMKIVSWKYQILLVLAVGVMQYSTNYVFSRFNVAYSLALFQFSTLISVVLGVSLFHEKGLKRKLIASLIMVVGSIILILE